MSGSVSSPNLLDRLADSLRPTPPAEVAPLVPARQQRADPDADQFEGAIRRANRDLARPVLTGGLVAVVPAAASGALMLVAGATLIGTFPVMGAVYVLGTLLIALGTYINRQDRAKRQICLHEADKFERRLNVAPEVDLVQALHCFESKSARFAEVKLGARHRELMVTGLRAKLRLIETRRRLPAHGAAGLPEPPEPLVSMDACRASLQSKVRVPWRSQRAAMRLQEATTTLRDEARYLDATALRGLTALLEARRATARLPATMAAAYDDVLLDVYTRRCALADVGPTTTAAAPVDLGRLP